MIVIAEILIFIMIAYDYKAYGLISTPVVILGGLYLVFIPMINILGPSMGFLTLTDKTIFLFLLFLLLIFVIGVIYSKIYSVAGGEYNSGEQILEKLLSKENAIWKLYLGSLFCYVVSLIQTINKYGVGNTKSNAYGPFAHIGFISRCLLPVIMVYFIKEKRPKYLIAVLINVVALILFKGKYHLFIPIASFIVLFLTINKHIKISKIIKIVIVTFLVAFILFIAVYTVLPNLVNGDLSAADMASGIKFSSRHFFHYLFSPFIASNTYFDHPVYRGMESGLRVNFNAFDVMYQQFLGDRDFYSPVITLWPTIETSGLTTNVGGLFSESVLNIGYFGAFLYVLGVTLISYHFMLQMILYNKRIISALTLLGTLMMSFFCNYFSLQPNLECFIYSYILDILIFDSEFVVFGKKIKIVFKSHY